MTPTRMLGLSTDMSSGGASSRHGTVSSPPLSNVADGTTDTERQHRSKPRLYSDNPRTIPTPIPTYTAELADERSERRRVPRRGSRVLTWLKSDGPTVALLSRYNKALMRKATSRMKRKLSSLPPTTLPITSTTHHTSRKLSNTDSRLGRSWLMTSVATTSNTSSSGRGSPTCMIHGRLLTASNTFVACERSTTTLGKLLTWSLT